MRIKITEDIDVSYAASMAKGRGLKTGADYKSFAAQSRQQPTMQGWFAVMGFAAGKWVDVETEYLFADQLNIGDPPGFVPPPDRDPRTTGARVDLRYVDAIDFAPEFSGPEDFLQAVQKRYDTDWPGSSVSRELINRLACGAMKDETNRKAEPMKLQAYRDLFIKGAKFRVIKKGAYISGMKPIAPYASQGHHEHLDVGRILTCAGSSMTHGDGVSAVKWLDADGNWICNDALFSHVIGGMWGGQIPEPGWLELV